MQNHEEEERRKQDPLSCRAFLAYCPPVSSWEGLLLVSIVLKWKRHLHGELLLDFEEAVECDAYESWFHFSEGPPDASGTQEGR
jgi:hypothetical protein